jgi:hypothetical protein
VSPRFSVLDLKIIVTLPYANDHKSTDTSYALNNNGNKNKEPFLVNGIPKDSLNHRLKSRAKKYHKYAEF